MNKYYLLPIIALTLLFDKMATKLFNWSTIQVAGVVLLLCALGILLSGLREGIWRVVLERGVVAAGGLAFGILSMYFPGRSYAEFTGIGLFVAVLSYLASQGRVQASSKMRAGSVAKGVGRI